MATEPSPDDAALERVPSPRSVLRRLLVELVYAPGRSAAIVLVALPYGWLAVYVARVALGVGSDPIIGGDWLTLLFTTYALFSSLALAHRILGIGLEGLTEEYLLDVVVLCWLTVFYFVWMLAREPVSETTTVRELYGPVAAGQPEALVWAAVVCLTGAVVAGLVHRPSGATKLFETEFRTALVTVPGLVTATVLLVRPGPDSLVWPFVGGAFIGTVGGGLTRLHAVGAWVGKGVFVVCSLTAWTVGAVGWLLRYRSRPPTDHVVLEHVEFGSVPGVEGDRPGEPPRESDHRRTTENDE